MPPAIEPAGDGEVEALRRGLEGVTPGPWAWFHKSSGFPFSLDDAKGNSVLAAEEYAGSAWIEIAKPDESWIARCSPDAIARLLSRLTLAEETARAAVEAKEKAEGGSNTLAST